MENTEKSSLELYEEIYTVFLEKATQLDMIEEGVIVPELVPHSKAFVLKWLECEEFKETFKGNATRYYFGIATNALIGGMYYAKVFSKDAEVIDTISFDSIYNGGLWNNVYALLEDHTDQSVNQLKLLAGDLFNVWSKAISPYFSHREAPKYLTDTLTAFFHIGIAIEYTVLGI